MNVKWEVNVKVKVIDGWGWGVVIEEVQVNLKGDVRVKVIDGGGSDRRGASECEGGGRSKGWWGNNNDGGGEWNGKHEGERDGDDKEKGDSNGGREGGGGDSNCGREGDSNCGARSDHVSVGILLLKVMVSNREVLVGVVMVKMVTVVTGGCKVGKNRWREDW